MSSEMRFHATWNDGEAAVYGTGLHGIMEQQRGTVFATSGVWYRAPRDDREAAGYGTGPQVTMG